MPLTVLALLFVVGAEYIGLSNFLPLYKALPIPLAITFFLLIHVLSKNSAGEFFQYKLVRYYSYFILFTIAAMFYGLVQSYAVEPVKTQVGYFMLTIVVFFLIDDQKKIKAYALMFVIVHIIIIVINFQKFGGAREGYFTASFFLGDGNDLAWSLNTALPMALYLAFTEKSKPIKLALMFGCFLLLLGIVGTQSRGAFLSLAAGLLFYFFFITKSKSTGVFLIALILTSVVALAPSNYFSRMETISSYEQDTSAMGRIKAWRTATEMALDHPLVGVGAGSFNSAYGRYYRKPGDPVRWISTHSVYFKILGEYGFTGVFIYLMMILHTIKTNFETARLIERSTKTIALNVLWPKYLNWSVISCSVGAMFLSGVSYPHMFLLAGLTLSANRIAKKQLEGGTDVPDKPAPLWHESNEFETNDRNWS